MKDTYISALVYSRAKTNTKDPIVLMFLMLPPSCPLAVAAKPGDGALSSYAVPYTAMMKVTPAYKLKLASSQRVYV